MRTRKTGMLGLYYLCFTILVNHSFARGIFPDVETAAQNLRSKREASCGGDVDVSNGTGEIQLVTEVFNGTEFYRVNEDCTWTVKTLPDHFMILRCDYFSLEHSDNCIWDYVEITEGGDAGSTSRFCGWDPMNYITGSSEITLRFKSDVSYEDDGFKFVVESKQRDVDVSRCDSSIIGGDDSRIMNNVKEGKGCLYRIQAPGNKVIELNLKMLDFGSAACDDESIVVYKGLSTQGEHLGKICSDTVPGEIQLYHVNMLFIEYRNLLQQEGERFTIEYSFVEDIFTPTTAQPTTPSPVGGNNDCSGMYKGIDTDSVYLNYTAPEYENHKECIIVVRNTQLQRHVVQIEFLYFDIEDSDNCMFDSLRIMSGERAESEELGGPYCGVSLHGRTFLTSGNSLRLEFKTDESIALRGFKARISFVPSKGCTCARNNQACIRQEHEKKCIRGQQCIENTCQNGGTCIKTGFTQKCYCPAGFEGDDCSQSDGELSSHIRFTVAPGDRALKRDESHTEECKVEIQHADRHRERVKYEWTFNGALIEAYAERTGFGSHPGGVLQIDKFTDELEGQYSCFATTSSGTAEHTFEYRIVENCNVRIYPGPQSESKKINENALLICHVPSAKAVRWKKDGVYINFDKRTKFKKLVNNYLQILDVTPSDSGTYQCEAEDNNGCYSYKEGTLTVVDVKPLNKYCGISIFDEVKLARPRIYRGYDARPNENPWHVTLRSRGGSSRHFAFCGGTLISRRYILTAAHCVREFEEKIKVPFEPENVVILLGTTNCLLTGDETTRTFKSFIVHPNFAPYDNDIALIELDSPVEYTDSIRPICLEPADYNDRVFLENSDSLSPVPGKVTGCGKTEKKFKIVEKLQELHIPYVNREECEDSLGSNKHKLTDRMFCAGSKIGKTGDTCSGDSGGGLVMATSTRWVQTGIVSWGLGCDVDKYYDIYTDVGRFYDWIEGVTDFSKEEVPDFLALS